jgi:hypothetical protein
MSKEEVEEIEDLMILFKFFPRQSDYHIGCV